MRRSFTPFKAATYSGESSGETNNMQWKFPSPTWPKIGPYTFESLTSSAVNLITWTWHSYRLGTSGSVHTCVRACVHRGVRHASCVRPSWVWVGWCVCVRVRADGRVVRQRLRCIGCMRLTSARLVIGTQASVIMPRLPGRIASVA